MPLLLLFIAIPLIEIALFIQLGSVLDLGWILLIVVLTAILGSWLVRQQGRGVLVELQRSMSELRDPTEPLVHGAMILFAGALLLTPGFFTDTIGFLLLIPAVRLAAFRWIRSRITLAGGVQGATFRRPEGPRPAPRSGDVIDGDYSEVSRGQEAPPSDRPSGWTRH